jgi:hypothetical protein
MHLSSTDSQQKPIAYEGRPQAAYLMPEDLHHSLLPFRFYTSFRQTALQGALHWRVDVERRCQSTCKLAKVTEKAKVAQLLGKCSAHRHAFVKNVYCYTTGRLIPRRWSCTPRWSLAETASSVKPSVMLQAIMSSWTSITCVGHRTRGFHTSDLCITCAECKALSLPTAIDISTG